jgi:hypothetical protein
MVTGPSNADCTGGATLVGGGAVITWTGGERGVVQTSAPANSGSQVNGRWTATGVALAAGNAGDTFTITAYALCAS